MKVLVTGSAGFIGSALCIKLLGRGDEVIGIDNHNDYYDPALKEARLSRHANHENYTHLRIDLADRVAMEQAFSEHKPQGVINLAAQAGVRYSIENPLAYVDSNIVGFRAYTGRLPPQPSGAPGLRQQFERLWSKHHYAFFSA
jgi:UDP-glucuronate 4-epimerase